MPKDDETMNIRRVYDLSRPLAHNCPGWAGMELTRVDKVATLPTSISNVERVTAVTHAATHADAPFHFLADGKTMDQVPPDAWIGEGVVVDIVGKGDKEVITYDDLERAGAHVRENDIVALRTGYGKFYGFNSKFIYDFPGIDSQSAKWFLDRRVKMLGVDTLGIERQDFPEGRGLAHETILGAGITIVEALNLEEIVHMGTKRWFFCWLPVLIQGAGGAFTRALAIDFDEA
jgi:arylformamidase